jgi:hypothetical protein
MMTLILGNFDQATRLRIEAQIRSLSGSRSFPVATVVALTGVCTPPFVEVQDITVAQQPFATELLEAIAMVCCQHDCPLTGRKPKLSLVLKFDPVVANSDRTA